MPRWLVGRLLKIICQNNVLLFNYHQHAIHKEEEILDFCQALSLCQPFLGHLLKYNIDSSQWTNRSRDIIIKMLPSFHKFGCMLMSTCFFFPLCVQNPPANEEESAHLSRRVVILWMLRFSETREHACSEKKTCESLMRQIHLVTWNLYKRSAVKDCLSLFCAHCCSMKPNVLRHHYVNPFSVLCEDL